MRERFCLRKRDVTQYGGDCIWVLDEQCNFKYSAVGFPSRYYFGTYILKRKTPDGWVKIGEVDDRLVTVRIRDVKGLEDSAINAIREDLRHGEIEGLY